MIQEERTAGYYMWDDLFVSFTPEPAYQPDHDARLLPGRANGTGIDAAALIPKQPVTGITPAAPAPERLPAVIGLGEIVTSTTADRNPFDVGNGAGPPPNSFPSFNPWNPNAIGIAQRDAQSSTPQDGRLNGYRPRSSFKLHPREHRLRPRRDRSNNRVHETANAPGLEEVESVLVSGGAVV